MPFPFRTPATEEWTPPDYARPVEASSDNEEWTPPSYATPVSKKKEGPSAFSRVISALKPATTIKPTGSLIPEALKTEEMKAINKKPQPPTDYGKRPDGTQKGEGFLGAFKLPNGSVASEYSIANSEKLKDEKGNYLDYPSLVPTLTREEVQAVLKAAAEGKPVPQSVEAKAEAHALKRKAEGRSLFAQPGEEDYTQHMDLARAPHYESDEEKAAKKKTQPEQKKGFLSSVTEAASKFLSEHPKIREAGQRFLTGTSPEFEAEMKKRGVSEIQGPGVMSIPGVKQATDYLSQKVAGSEGTGRLAAGAVVQALGGLLEGGFDPRTAGIKGPEAALPVRQSREVPYKMEASPKVELPQTRPDKLKDFMKKNPGATMADIEEFTKSVTAAKVKPPEVSTVTPTETPEELKSKPPVGRVAQIQKEKQIPFSEAKRLADEEAAAKPSEEVKKPFVSPFEKKAEEKTFEQTLAEFGGSGHPESPEYVGKVLNKAGKGEPGLSVEPIESDKVADLNTQHVVYRGKDGEPVAVAKLARDQNGKYLVMDLAADKSKGLLTGRAMKALGGKLEELGATEAAGTVSSDAQNFIAKMKSRKAPETEWKPPEYAKPVEINASGESAASQEAINRQASMKAKGEQYVVYDRAGNARPLIGPEAVDYTPKKGETFGIQTERGFKTLEDKGGKIPSAASLADRTVARLQSIEDEALERIKQRGTFKGGRLTAGLPADDLGDFAVIGAAKIAKGVVKFADWSAEMIKDFGEAIKPHLQAIFKAAQSKHSELGLANLDKDIATEGSLRKLMNSLIENKGARAEQQELYKAERAKRFSQFRATGGEGIDWAKKALSTLKGEYEKVNPGEGLGLTRSESNSLFSTIKRSNISVPEQARAVESIFKLMNGESTLQPNEIDLLDKVFGKHLASVSGPGAAMPYDIAAGEAASKISPKSFREAVAQKPNDFLTKLANFSSKTTRAVLGFHIPGTAVSFHGFNEAIRHTLFGPNFNPFKSAGRFGEAAYYLTRPGKAQEFLDINLEGLGKAIDEGGLKVSTGDIGTRSLFKGNNFLTRGLNALTSPKPLFEQVIPALKLKSYEGLLEQYEKSGMEHAQAAKLAGYATNNIYGGLNLQALERSPHTQKLFRVFALAPDWLETNARLGKGMLKSIKNPTSAEGRVYMVGAANFLGAYTAMNILNAINNDGRFSFQNEVGHELDVAIGKDSSGRVRYFRPFGTAMDMIRIPLEIAHAAVEGNLGRGFSDIRSRASEPIQFMTDMMTNTDYAGRALYDKTKYGKPIPPLEQGENILGSAAGHFLPVGAEAGINLAQGKVSPEQFAAQVLQLPMGYKMPPKQKGPLSFKKKKLKP